MPGVRNCIAMNPKSKKSEEPKKKRSTYSERFDEHYFVKYEAILDAAQSLWSLNHYAKISGSEYCDAIYGLKNRFLKWLCELGFLIARGKRMLEDRKLECWDCEDFGYSKKCGKCRGTGIVYTIPASCLAVLNFEICGRIYVWKTPQSDLDWNLPDVEILETEYEKIDDDENDDEFDEAPKIQLTSPQITEAKALIEWVMDV